MIVKNLETGVERENQYQKNRKIDKFLVGGGVLLTSLGGLAGYIAIADDSKTMAAISGAALYMGIRDILNCIYDMRR